MQQQHGQAEYERGKGGRIKELEAPELLVDEFRKQGNPASADEVVLQKREELFHKYEAKLEVC